MAKGTKGKSQTHGTGGAKRKIPKSVTKLSGGRVGKKGR